jgi:hypothetical protein
MHGHGVVEFIAVEEARAAMISQVGKAIDPADAVAELGDQSIGLGLAIAELWLDDDDLGPWLDRPGGPQVLGELAIVGALLNEGEVSGATWARIWPYRGPTLTAV